MFSRIFSPRLRLARRLWLCLPLAAITVAAGSTSAPPVIQEFLAQNTAGITDEDGSFSDWIEIHNPGASAVDLGGWHLTDRVDQPTMWSFPETTLEPGGYLVVFASGKNRRVPGQPLHTNFALAASGEYLALIAPDGATRTSEFSPVFPPQTANVSYGRAMNGTWQRLSGKGDPVRVLVPNESTGPALGSSWRERVFDDSAWLAGTLAVGFKTGTADALGMRSIFETDLQGAMYNLPNRTSVYLRVPFQIDNPAAVTDLELRTQYDDGYASFLNGGSFAVDAANAPASLTWQSTATAIQYDANGLPLRVSNMDSYLDRLVEGTNIVAVHGLNANQTSSDLLIAPQVWARISESSGPGIFGYFSTPSPGVANPGTEGMILFSEIVFSESSRTFTGSMPLMLGGAAAGQVIRYTTDGSAPQANSTLYTGPLTLHSTTRIRARVFDAKGIGSATATQHYTRLAADVAGRRSRLPMVVLDAHNQTLNSSNRTAAFFQLFDRDGNGISALSGTPHLATRQGLRWRGSSSESQPKKPYSVEFWDDNNEEVRHPLLGMTSESDWVFYAPYHFDRAFIRNSVAYEMSRRIGRWAPATRFVEVFFNADGGDLGAADYAGVYAIVEQVKMNTRRLGFSTVNPGDIPPPGAINVAASGPWTGGYLFKIDRTDPDEYNWLTTRGIPGGIAWLTLNRPKMPDLDGGPYFSNAAAEAGSRQVAYLRTYVQAFENALYADQANGFATRQHLDFIERDSWIDHLLVNAFAKNVDALRLSGFFHKPGDQPLIAGPVWDFDRSMDSYDNRDDAFNTWSGTSDSTNYFTYDWWGVLAQDPDFRQAFYDRWAELRKGPFSNGGLADIIQPMGAEIDDSTGGLGSAAQRDAAKWPSANSPRAGGYPAEIQHLLTWMQSRAGWMDRRTLAGGLLPAAPQATLSSDPLPAGGTVTLSGLDGTIYYRLDGGDPRASVGRPMGTRYTGPITIHSPSRLVARVRSSSGDWSTPTELVLLAPNPGPVFLPGGSGDWTDRLNWDSNPAPYPDGAGAAAVIGPPTVEADRNIDLRAPVTIGRLTFPQGASAVRNRVRNNGEVIVGNTLGFDNNGLPARLEVGGNASGYVEFEVAAGTILHDSLEIDVSNLVGNPEFGALRLREQWSGPGGLTKQGAGVASLTGEGKIYQGPTRIEEGVLRVTGPSTMTASSSVTVLDGGQLRLVSASTPGNPRVHAFGGDLFLSGYGRGSEVPDGEGQGKLGALRYDPGTQDNHAIVTNSIEFPAAADVHVDGSMNLLEIAGVLRGPGSLTKTGGGTLALAGDSPAYAAPLILANGGLRLRGRVASPVQVAANTDLDVAGSSGAATGAGRLLLAASTWTVPSVSGMVRSLVFTRTGAPDAMSPHASGNALIITSDPGTALALDLLIDDDPQAGSRYQGAYLLPAGASWSQVLDPAVTRVLVRDPAGNHSAWGKTWSQSASATLTRVPATVQTPDGSSEGRMLEIRFDDQPLTFSGWRATHFGDPSDDALAGPLADPTSSGVPNLLRFAFGLTAAEDPSAALPVVGTTPDGVRFGFRYDPALLGLRWMVEAAEDPGDWSAAEILFDSETNLALPDPDGRLWIEDDNTHERRFFRLRLTESGD